MRASLTQRAYMDWERYWRTEPWGPWRDNLHVAILGRELRRPQLKPGIRVNLNDFMVRDPEERRREQANNLINFLRTVSKLIKREDAQ